MQIGDRVRKKRGSSWQGIIVGSYSTMLTPVGWCVESEREPGSVQIYPEAALELLTETNGCEAHRGDPSPFCGSCTARAE